MLTIHAPADDGPAVAVEGVLIAAAGPLAELRAAYPRARVRHWAGTLGPGLVQQGVRELLQDTYHPDPRDQDRPRDRTESVRRGIHGLLTRGVTAVVDDSTDPVVRAALDRSGLRSVAPGTVPIPPTPGARADLAVFAPDGSCLATVLGGRLVHRRA